MIIETQNTPEENVINFFPPVQILKSGTAEFADAKSIRKSPLAEQIFDLGGIVSVLCISDPAVRAAQCPGPADCPVRGCVVADAVGHGRAVAGRGLDSVCGLCGAGHLGPVAPQGSQARL